MLLKDLKEGQRFEFSDKKTPIGYPGSLVYTFPARGIFRYIGNAIGSCPILLHELSNEEITAVSRTYQRDVLVIL